MRKLEFLLREELAAEGGFFMKRLLQGSGMRSRLNSIFILLLSDLLIRYKLFSFQVSVIDILTNGEYSMALLKEKRKKSKYLRIIHTN